MCVCVCVCVCVRSVLMGELLDLTGKIDFFDIRTPPNADFYCINSLTYIIFHTL